MSMVLRLRNPFPGLSGWRHLHFPVVSSLDGQFSWPGPVEVSYTLGGSTGSPESTGSPDWMQLEEKDGVDSSPLCPLMDQDPWCIPGPGN